MWASATQLVTAVVSVISLGWLIVTQVRSSSARKNADRAETAARLLTALEKIGVGGIDSHFDALSALEIHQDQVRRLQEVVRMNTAEFDRRAQRLGWSLSSHLLIGIYGVLLLTVVPGSLGRIENLPTDQQWAGVLLVGGLFLASIAMMGGSVAAFYRRHVARAVKRNAGQYVPGVIESVSGFLRGFSLWRLKRRAAAQTPALKETHL
jgi:hypothetical protein